MATIAFTTESITMQIGQAQIITWVLNAGDDGVPFQLEFPAERSVQAFGTFGTSLLSLQATNDSGVTPVWQVVNGPASALFLATIQNLSLKVRPILTAGTSTGITVKMFVLQKP